MAASALIDPAMVMQLQAAQIETVAGLAVAHSRDADPDTHSWARIEPPRLVWRDRQRGQDESDIADFETDVLVCVGPPKTKAGAIATASGKVVLAFDGVTLRDAATTHQVDCQRCRLDGITEVDEERRIEVALVVVRGRVKRVSGRTMLDFLT